MKEYNRREFLGLATVGLALAGCGKRVEERVEEDENQKNTIIKQIDVIGYELKNTDEVDNLMSLFSDTFQLPLAWSAQNIKGMYCGNLWIGNVLFEIQRSTNKENNYYLLLEPKGLSMALDEQDKRGILYGNSRVHTETDLYGQKQMLWTNVPLSQFSRSGTSVLLCEVNPRFFSTQSLIKLSTPPTENIDQFRNYLRQKLNKRDGGPLGIQYVNEVVIGVTDFKESEQLWQNLLDPIQPIDKGLWEIGEGPAIRIVPASEYGIQSIDVKVKSLEQARNFLKANGMLGQVYDNTVVLKKERFYGLDIRLQE